MLLTEYEKAVVLNGVKDALIAAAVIFCVVFIQQSYARQRECGIEQPVGLLGIAEYFFRHPEVLIGLHFQYPVQGVDYSEAISRP